MILKDKVTEESYGGARPKTKFKSYLDNMDRDQFPTLNGQISMNNNMEENHSKALDDQIQTTLIGSIHPPIGYDTLYPLMSEKVKQRECMICQESHSDYCAQYR